MKQKSKKIYEKKGNPYLRGKAWTYIYYEPLPNQIAFAILGEIGRLFGGAAEFCNLILILPVAGGFFVLKPR